MKDEEPAAAALRLLTVEVTKSSQVQEPPLLVGRRDRLLLAMIIIRRALSF